MVVHAPVARKRPAAEWCAWQAQYDARPSILRNWRSRSARLRLQSDDMRLKVLGMPVPPKLPSCPFCQTPMRLVSILPRRAGQPKIRPFKCRLCRKEVTEIADEEEPST